MRFLTLKCLARASLFYCAALIFSLMLVFGLGAVHKDTIVFFAETNKPEFMQLYFPVFKDDSIYPSYSAENSERVAYEGKPGLGIGLALPDGAIKSLRVDPADSLVNMTIKSVQLNYLFSTVTLTPTELLARIIPLQGVDKIEVVGDVLVISATAPDPQFELSIFKPGRDVNYKRLLLLSFASSLVFAVLFFALAKGVVQGLLKIAPGFFVPVSVTLLISWMFYPGFMTFDTFHALEGARSGVVDSTWPPVVSYVWRVVDIVSRGPVAMLFSQLLLLLGAVYYVMYYFLRRHTLSTAFFLLYLIVPVVIGTIAAIWKDVLMASFFVAAFAVMLAMKEPRSRPSLLFLFGVSIFLVFLAVCTRHNAITAAVPLLFYSVWIFSKRSPSGPSSLAFVIVSGLILSGAVYTVKIQFDRYSVPEFREIKGATKLIRITRVMDIAGASICAEKNLFESIAPALALSEIKAGYDPRHSNLSSGLFSKLPFDESVDTLWFSVVKEYPVCIGYNKLMLAKFLVGGNSGEPFLVVTPQVDSNKYGYSLPSSNVRDEVVQYVLTASKLVIFKPWCLYLISILLFMLLVALKKVSVEIVVVYLSAGFYFAGLALFGNAADARLLFYTNTMSLLGIVLITAQLAGFRLRKTALAGTES
ncbi:hypothetical protein HT737_06705 [Pseudomonas sp. MD195_PC81_125]|uniref:hypothetical protein n=1 Tax=Pseudomonas sp. MD195_PC81_125 TaxID=2741560 RepID=UPI0015FA20EE|nr:hypothetical protein [Pseudomonas sp. MD195_PC81_125]MBA5979751.1 hypothetical protein [Pseudomonas sp. MD195_PC81_125]